MALGRLGMEESVAWLLAETTGMSLLLELMA
jgi:hypothetical protein